MLTQGRRDIPPKLRLLARKAHRVIWGIIRPRLERIFTGDNAAPHRTFRREVAMLGDPCPWHIMGGIIHHGKRLRRVRQALMLKPQTAIGQMPVLMLKIGINRPRPEHMIKSPTVLRRDRLTQMQGNIGMSQHRRDNRAISLGRDRLDRMIEIICPHRETNRQSRKNGSRQGVRGATPLFLGIGFEKRLIESGANLRQGRLLNILWV